MSDERPIIHDAQPLTDDAVWDAIARRVAGEETPESRELLDAEIARRQGRAELVGSLGEAVRFASTGANAEVDVGAALGRARATRDRASVHTLPIAQARRKKAVVTRRQLPWRAAAALAVVAGSGLLLRHALSEAPVTASAPPLKQQYATGIGGRDSVTLLDGTRVILGPASTLVVPADYEVASREVTLTGEASFDVVHDLARPFTVHVGEAIAKDLGTVFVVRQDDDDVVAVAVRDGSVELSSERGADAPAVLRAGDAGQVQRGHITLRPGAASREEGSFAEGRLAWRDAPVSRVVADMRRWYGVTLVVRDSALAHRHLTASFHGESADQALRIVATALGGDLRRKGDSAIVSGPAGRRTKP